MSAPTSQSFPTLNRLLCSASATDIIRCLALIRLMRHLWTQHAICGPRRGPIPGVYSRESLPDLDRDFPCEIMVLPGPTRGFWYSNLSVMEYT